MVFIANSVSSIRPSNAKKGVLTVEYSGRTFDANQTEIFVDGINGRRVYLTPGTGVIITLLGSRYNNNSNAINYTNSFAALTVSNSGVAAFADTDNTTAGTQGVSELAHAVFNPGGAVVTKANSLGWSTGSGMRIDVVNASGSTPANFRLSVFGVASSTVDWEFCVTFVEAGGRIQ